MPGDSHVNSVLQPVGSRLVPWLAGGPAGAGSAILSQRPVARSASRWYLEEDLDVAGTPLRRCSSR